MNISKKYKCQWNSKFPSPQNSLNTAPVLSAQTCTLSQVNFLTAVISPFNLFRKLHQTKPLHTSRTAMNGFHL